MNNTMNKYLENKKEGDINRSEARKKWMETNIGEKTQQLLERDNNCFLHQSLSTPCMNGIESCESIYIKDLEGRQYMDFHGNNVHQLGYGNKYVIDKATEAMNRLSFSPRRYTNWYAVNFAEKILGYAPTAINRLLFAPAGTLSVGMAIKLARLVTGKHKIVSTWDSFHGASLDAISAGGQSLFRKNMEPLMPGVVHIPPYNCFNGFFKGSDADLQYAEYLDYVLSKEPQVGAFLSETIRNTVVHVPSKRYWKKISEICNKHKVMLILDEIPIALGRTGKMFAFEHFDIIPDAVLIGKGLGGGFFPMSAILTKNEYNIGHDTSIGHYTHEKSPVGSAAGMATLEYYEKKQVLAHVDMLSKYVYEFMAHLRNQYDIIADIRGIGLLWGIELLTDKISGTVKGEMAEKIMYNCLENGLSFKISGGNVLTLSPPLIISNKELQKAFEIIEKALKNNN